MQSNDISPSLYSQLQPSSSSFSLNCQICLGTNEEIACILASLFDCLRDMSIKQGMNQNKGENKGEGCGGFSKLVELIFHSKCKNWRDTMSCSHSKCQKYFMKEIGVSGQVLDRLSNLKMIDLGKFNFHMDVVSLQAKSFHRHFIVQSSHKHIKLQDKKGSQPGSKKSIALETKTATNKSPTVKQQANQYQQGFDCPINLIYGINQNEMYMYGGAFGEGDGVGGFTQLMKNMFYMGYGFDGTS